MHSNSQIIIVTEQMDLHADDVIQALNIKGHPVIRLNTDDIPLKTLMTCALHSGKSSWGGHITIETNGRTIELENIRSIWWRRPGEYQFPEDLPLRQREFAKMEIEEALMGLWAHLDCYWISHPHHIRHAEWKPGQLQRAVELGFSVPKTLITNDPAEVRDFYDLCDGQMIYKVLSDPQLAAYRMASKYPDQPIELIATSTTLMTETELAQLETIRLAPCQFQNLIPKQFELRVTVIGDDLFTAAIDASAYEQEWLHLGWKAMDPEEHPWRKFDLPHDIAERCMAFVQSYQLQYSAIDLILTPEGEYVFIENNPNGQFIWVEMIAPELRMIDALTDCLIRGLGS